MGGRDDAAQGVEALRRWGCADEDAPGEVEGQPDADLPADLAAIDLAAIDLALGEPSAPVAEG